MTSIRGRAGSRRQPSPDPPRRSRIQAGAGSRREPSMSTFGAERTASQRVSGPPKLARNGPSEALDHYPVEGTPASLVMRIN